MSSLSGLFCSEASPLQFCISQILKNNSTTSDQETLRRGSARQVQAPLAPMGPEELEALAWLGIQVGHAPPSRPPRRHRGQQGRTFEWTRLDSTQPTLKETELSILSPIKCHKTSQTWLTANHIQREYNIMQYGNMQLEYIHEITLKLHWIYLYIHIFEYQITELLVLSQSGHLSPSLQTVHFNSGQCDGSVIFHADRGRTEHGSGKRRLQSPKMPNHPGFVHICHIHPTTVHRHVSNDSNVRSHFQICSMFFQCFFDVFFQCFQICSSRFSS